MKGNSKEAIWHFKNKWAVTMRV